MKTLHEELVRLRKATTEQAEWPGAPKARKGKVSKKTAAQKRTGHKKKGDRLPIDATARREYAARKREAGAHGASLGRDKDGYFVYTHRARSKSYPSAAKIPLDRIRFVSSTS